MYHTVTIVSTPCRLEQGTANLDHLRTEIPAQSDDTCWDGGEPREKLVCEQTDNCLSIPNYVLLVIYIVLPGTSLCEPPSWEEIAAMYTSELEL